MSYCCEACVLMHHTMCIQSLMLERFDETQVIYAPPTQNNTYQQADWRHVPQNTCQHVKTQRVIARKPTLPFYIWMWLCPSRISRCWSSSGHPLGLANLNFPDLNMNIYIAVRHCVLPKQSLLNRNKPFKLFFSWKFY